MEKQIKDYLHLYLGCKCLCEKSNYHLVHNLSIHNGEQFDLTIRVLAALEGQSTSIIKPILRRLTSIKEEEVNDLWALLGWNEKISNPQERLGNILGEFMVNEHDDDFHPAQWKYLLKILPYLLSKGFDLWNLIDEGLAIDAKTITTKS